MSFYSGYGKRVFDVAGSVAGLILSAPVLVIVGGVILLDSGPPVLFVQTRVGRGGRLFSIYKLRTMVVGAELCGSVSIARDRRMTRSGRLIRRLKLDELPQLWNVLCGDMSLVGPRPDVPGYADALQGEARRILELRPGITGPATLAFSNEEELLARVANPEDYSHDVIFAEKVRLNLKYQRELTFAEDLRCLARTIGLWRNRRSDP